MTPCAAPPGRAAQGALNAQMAVEAPGKSLAGRRRLPSRQRLCPALPEKSVQGNGARASDQKPHKAGQVEELVEGEEAGHAVHLAKLGGENCDGHGQGHGDGGEAGEEAEEKEGAAKE